MSPGHLRCVWGTCGGQIIFWCVRKTCGGKIVFLLVSGASAVAKYHSCLYLENQWWQNHIRSCTCGSAVVNGIPAYLLVSGHPRWRSGIPACICITCGCKTVFLLVSGAPTVANWYSCLNLKHQRWRNCIPACIWGTCGDEMVFLLISGKPAVAKW